MKITLISDLHNKYKQLTLPGGDIIICSGDMTSRGYKHEIENFCKWFSNLDNYKHKVFISGNHDFGFEERPAETYEMIAPFNITYLQDSFVVIDGVKIYGTPWQPEFNHWAFNLPKNSDRLQEKWNMIPVDTDILLTHGPPFGILDKVIGGSTSLGCELLLDKVKNIKPKIHVFGHIHTGYGYVRDDNTHFFNASILNEDYIYTQKPWNIDWDKDTNEITW